jgi:hypothetical protein
MNTYAKYCPNVFLAKCEEQHKKGSTIILETKYGQEHECVVFNLIYQKDGFYYYSIVRSDGFNAQEWAKRKAERLNGASARADAKSNDYWKASQEGKDFLVLAEPIKMGHHSEKKHRALIERNHNRMGKSVEFSKKADSYNSRAEYWEKRANTINLSMPESLEYYEFELEKVDRKHQGLKDGTIERSHSFSLTYAKKEVNELTKKVELAKKLWA